MQKKRDFTVIQNFPLRTVYPVSLGCAKNQVDLERILGELHLAGFQTASDLAESEYLLVNTCGFIDPAKEESIDAILEIVRSRRPGQRIVVMGCLSQRYAQELPAEMPEVDLWTGTYQPGKILELIGEHDLANLCRRESVPRQRIGTWKHHAYLKIAEGCNRSCAFCAIPGIRGKQHSSDIPELVAEAQFLTQHGVRELSLIAQDLTFYGREKNGPGTNLETLVRALLSDTDLHWIRLMYAYPEFVEDSLLQLMAENPRICKYLDMPIQHASNAILRRMHRKSRVGELRKLLLRLRDQVPGIALRTTALVGFPGETDRDFEALMDLAAEIRFERLGGFVFSREEGTVAASLPDQVPTEVAQERLDRLLAQQAEISLERNQSLIGQNVEVILDDVGDESEFHFFGRTQWDAPDVDNAIRVLDGDGEPGQFRRAHIVDASAFDLDATLLPLPL
ncbi:MAG TPA: 30S ribosomal protein S12 methylthiotransferase RimO [Fibrobacteraceae bacterium]|nr:30S ribosomal protein S12 methylthiotransferase RimO [Fibrobacteraceae bacterium]